MKPHWPKTSRQKAAKRARGEALSADQVDALVGNQTVDQIQTAAAKAQAADSEALRYRHEFDEDAVCIHCGFDGAEWGHWKRNTYEGRASDAKQPLCERRR